MVLWICVGVLIVAVVVLGALLIELRAKKVRLDAAVTRARTQTEPAIGVVRTLAQTSVPNLKPSKPKRTLVGQSTADSSLA